MRACTESNWVKVGSNELWGGGGGDNGEASNSVTRTNLNIRIAISFSRKNSRQYLCRISLLLSSLERTKSLTRGKITWHLDPFTHPELFQQKPLWCSDCSPQLYHFLEYVVALFRIS